MELYTHHRSVHNIVSHLQASNFRVSATHLVDSHYCSDPAKFISVLLTSLCTMLQGEGCLFPVLLCPECDFNWCG